MIENDIKNYSFEYKRLNPAQIECFIITPDKNKFFISVNSQSQPPDSWVFDNWKDINRRKTFTLECDSVILKDDGNDKISQTGQITIPEQNPS